MTSSPRIAVLGAGGFIGSHLVRRLLSDGAGRGSPRPAIDAVDVSFARLDGVVDDRLRRIEARIDAPGLLEEITARADVVFSLTALCNPALYNTRPLDVIDASYTDIVPLVKLCAARGRRLIHLSTCEVHGRAALDGDGAPMERMVEDETGMFLGPVHKERWSYAAAKQLLERVIWAHGRHAGLAFTIVRPFNVVGPRMDFVPGVDGEGLPRVLACFMHALMTGADLVLVDGGGQRRAFLEVGEMVDGLCRVLAEPARCRGEILNLGNPDNDVTIRGLAEALVGAFRAQRPGAPPPRLRVERAASFYGAGYDDSIVRVPSIAKAERLLGWRPRVTLGEMLPGIVADYLARYEPLLRARPPERLRGAS